MADSHGGDSLDPALQEQGLNRSPLTSLECIAAFRNSGHLFSGGGACLEAPEYLLDFTDHVLGTYETNHLTYPCRPAQRDAFSYRMKTLAFSLMCCCAADQVVALSLRSQRLLVLTPAYSSVKHIS